MACQKGHVHIINALLQHKAIEVNHLNSRGKNALLEACYNKDIMLAALLLNSGKVNVNAKDPMGNTALHIISGISRKREDTQTFVQLLLVHKASLTRKNNNNLTAFDLAIAQNNHAAMTAILTIVHDKKLDPLSIISPTTLRNLIQRNLIHWTAANLPTVTSYLKKYLIFNTLCAIFFTNAPIRTGKPLKYLTLHKRATRYKRMPDKTPDKSAQKQISEEHQVPELDCRVTRALHHPTTFASQLSPILS